MYSESDFIDDLHQSLERMPDCTIDPHDLRARASARKVGRRRAIMATCVLSAGAIALAFGTLGLHGSADQGGSLLGGQLAAGSGPGCGNAVIVDLKSPPSSSTNGSVRANAVLQILRPTEVRTFSLVLARPGAIAFAGPDAQSQEQSVLNPANQLASEAMSNSTSSSPIPLTLTASNMAPGVYPLFALITYSDLAACDGQQNKLVTMVEPLGQVNIP